MSGAVQTGHCWHFLCWSTIVTSGASQPPSHSEGWPRAEKEEVCCFCGSRRTLMGDKPQGHGEFLPQTEVGEMYYRPHHAFPNECPGRKPPVTFDLLLEAPKGWRVESVAKLALEHAASPVGFIFNGIEVRIEPGDCPDSLVDRYMKVARGGIKV